MACCSVPGGPATTTCACSATDAASAGSAVQHLPTPDPPPQPAGGPGPPALLWAWHLRALLQAAQRLPSGPWSGWELPDDPNPALQRRVLWDPPLTARSLQTPARGYIVSPGSHRLGSDTSWRSNQCLAYKDKARVFTCSSLCSLLCSSLSGLETSFLWAILLLSEWWQIRPLGNKLHFSGLANKTISAICHDIRQQAWSHSLLLEPLHRSFLFFYCYSFFPSPVFSFFMLAKIGLFSSLSMFISLYPTGATSLWGRGVPSPWPWPHMEVGWWASRIRRTSSTPGGQRNEMEGTWVPRTLWPKCPYYPGLRVRRSKLFSLSHCYCRSATAAEPIVLKLKLSQA